MSSELVSIIIPVYNCEKYLHDCISSVRLQTHPYLDIVLVDDGSIDGSAELCDSQAAADSRIRAVHQPNAGVSTARNVGLSIAQGSWVWFIDSDDVIENDAVETLLEDAARANGDVVVMDIAPFDDSGDLPHSILADGPFPNRIESSGKGLEEELLKNSIGNYACGFFYRMRFARNLVRDGELFDSRFSLFEDVALSHRVASTAHRVAYEPRALYRYRQLGDSTTHRKSVEIAKSGFEAISFLKDLPVSEELRPFRDKRYCQLCLIDYDIAGSGHEAVEFKKTVREAVRTAYSREVSRLLPSGTRFKMLLLVFGILDFLKSMRNRVFKVLS